MVKPFNYYASDSNYNDMVNLCNYITFVYGDKKFILKSVVVSNRL